MFSERESVLLALIETRLKGNREVSWCEVSGIIAGVQKIKRGREGVSLFDKRCVTQLDN